MAAAVLLTAVLGGQALERYGWISSNGDGYNPAYIEIPASSRTGGAVLTRSANQISSFYWLHVLEASFGAPGTSFLLLQGDLRIQISGDRTRLSLVDNGFSGPANFSWLGIFRFVGTEQLDYAATSPTIDDTDYGFWEYAAPAAQLPSTHLDFGRVLVGRSKTIDVPLSNNGARFSLLTATPVSQLGGAQGANFRPSTATRFNINQGSSVAIPVTFFTSGDGVFTGSGPFLASSNGGIPSVTASGRGINQLGLAAVGVTFGRVLRGATVSAPARVIQFGVVDENRSRPVLSGVQASDGTATILAAADHTFNLTPESTSVTRTMTGSFPVAGNRSGSIPLTILPEIPGPEGDGPYNVSFPYSAEVYSPVTISVPVGPFYPGESIPVTASGGPNPADAMVANVSIHSVGGGSFTIPGLTISSTRVAGGTTYNAGPVSFSPASNRLNGAPASGTVTLIFTNATNQGLLVGSSFGDAGSVTRTLLASVGGVIAPVDQTGGGSNFGADQTAPVPNGGAYTSLSTTAAVLGGGRPTSGSTLRFRGGANLSGSEQTLSVAWRARLTEETTSGASAAAFPDSAPFGLYSDVARVGGTGSSPYAVGIVVDPALQGSLPLAGLQLGRRGPDGRWERATRANNGVGSLATGVAEGGAFSDQGAPGLADDLGRFGFDPVTQEVWAVLNVGADLAVIAGLNGSLVVTTTADGVNPADGETTLREALAFAAMLPGPDVVTFAPPLAGQVILLSEGATGPTDTTALRIDQAVTVRGPASAPGVILAVAPGTPRRHFFVAAGGNLTLENLTLRDGRAADTDFGGAVWSFGRLTVRGCLFADNRAGEGGAVQSWGASPRLWIENSTFHGNRAVQLGSAISAGAVETALTHLTIVGNTSDRADGGVLWLYETAAQVRNCLIVGNSPERFQVFGVGAAGPGSVSNLVGAPPGEAAGLVAGVDGNRTGVALAEARLGALGPVGGPAFGMPLLAGSPAINLGTNTGLSQDQAGAARVVAGAPDAGALEDPVGEGDADGDNLSNLEELDGRTSPVSIDTDGDGFNDPTEVLNGTDPRSAASQPSGTYRVRVLGTGPAEGLDWSGNFIYAVNVGPAGLGGTVGDALFGDDSTPGVMVSAVNVAANWAPIDFGSDPSEDVLERVFSSHRWSAASDPNPAARPTRADLSGLVPGRRYRLQLLFGDPAYARQFSIWAEGAVLAENFSPWDVQGRFRAGRAAAALVHEFTAGDPVLNVAVDVAAAVPPGVDSNPMLSGLTLEAIPTPAAPVLILPSATVHEGAVTVSLSTPSVGAAIRYTLDGTDPTATLGRLYSGPFRLLRSATVRAVAVGGGWEPSAVTSAFFEVRSAVDNWRTSQGLPADGSRDLETPAGDGVPNLLKFAFNLTSTPGDLAAPRAEVLAPGGTAGLPRVWREGDVLVLEFVRRRASTLPGVAYLPEFSPNLVAWSPFDLGAAVSEGIDGVWERVRVTAPLVDGRGYARVRVVVLGSFVSDFNLDASGAEFRGAAVWLAGRVRLVEALNGQIGSMVLPGPVVAADAAGFDARFRLACGPTTNFPADGASFVVGDVGPGPFGEGGPGTPGTLALRFDTYDNGVGVEQGIGISAWVGGTLIAYSPRNPFTNGAYVPVVVEWDAVNGLTVLHDGVVVFDRVTLPGFQLRTGDRFGFGARTGGFNHESSVDDIEIRLR